MIDTQRIKFLNTYIDNLTFDEAKNCVDKLIQQPGYHYVVTPNTDIIVKMNNDDELKKICENADLILTDGQILVKLSKKYGEAIKERVCMTDFVWDVFNLAIQRKYKIFLLGGKEETLEKAVFNVKNKMPNLDIVDYYSPSLGFENDERLLMETNDRIKKSGADILLVFLGCPKQEKFIANNKNIYQVPISFTMGGCVDFLAGDVKRAPIWMQNVGLEWFYRFMQEPKRMFKRYFLDDMKIFALARKYGKYNQN